MISISLTPKIAVFLCENIKNCSVNFSESGKGAGTLQKSQRSSGFWPEPDTKN